MIYVSLIRNAIDVCLIRNAQQMWTDEDLVTLAKLIKKIPGGSSDR